MIKIKFEPPIIQAIPLSPDDLIEVQCLSSTVPVTLDLEGTCYNEQGDLVPFQQSLIVPTAVTLSTFRIRLGYKFLLSAVLSSRTASIPDGSCYCRISLCKSESGGVFPYRKILSQGYVSTYGSIGYGSASISGSPTDHFFLDNIVIPQPAAGQNLTYTCPSFTMLKIIALSFTGAFSATVITRYPIVRVSLPSGSYHWWRDTTGGNASTAYRYTFSDVGSPSTGPIGSNSNSPLPQIFLYPQSTIDTAILSLQGGDQLSDCSLLALRRTIPF